MSTIAIAKRHSREKKSRHLSVVDPVQKVFAPPIGHEKRLAVGVEADKCAAAFSRGGVVVVDTRKGQLNSEGCVESVERRGKGGPLYRTSRRPSPT